MSILGSQNSDQEQHSGVVGDDNFENDDLITFQHDSKTINLHYSQFTKYSKHIRELYLFSDVFNRFPQEIYKFQEESQILPENIELFFQLLQQNYNINGNFALTYIQCIDLLKISKYLEVRKLSFKINQYIKDHNVDVDFIFQMIQYEMKTHKETDNYPIEISNEIENLLTSKINECFSNEKFKELPIQIIYRVIKQSSPDSINSNKLYDIIMQSLGKFCVLFQFLDLQKLSDDRLEDLCEKYSKSNENNQHFFDYLKCNLNLISEINNRKKTLQEMNNQQQNKMNNLEEKISSLQSQLDDSKSSNCKQQNKMSDLEEKIESLQKKFNDSEKVNDQLQKQFNDSEKVNDQLKSQLDESEKSNNQQKNKINELETQINQLQSKLTSSEKEINDINIKFKQLYQIEGQIVSSVENGILINVEINLKTKLGALDTDRSKIIISTSDAKNLGNEAYEKGEPITSLHMKTSFACKSGTYYVRCIVFNTDGESNEIVSNSVTTSGSSLTFDYEGKPSKIQLPQGRYKLEVWGAKGGDGTGNGQGSRGSSTVKGGLGGYSRGILNLNKNETVYVFVGGEGRPSDSTEGSTTKGGFPDGGGTRTGYCTSYQTVPGTGGGSTSIRIGNDTDYSRVIVAGGGGGAGGDCYNVDPGGFGGGKSGGNCSYCQSLQNQGAGTQTGSTQGLGHANDRHGDPGRFGSGATGKYSQGRHSGGGGGGGWYGGGSGGFGAHNRCSSGGGGSGWTFTDSCMKAWKLGDSANATKFTLDNTHYLTEEKCLGGNEEFPRPDGNGNERGHSGNGYAKITLL